MNSRKYDTCNIEVQRATYAKHLRFFQTILKLEFKIDFLVKLRKRWPVFMLDY